MAHLIKSALIVAALGLSACTGADRFGRGSADDGRAITQDDTFEQSTLDAAADSRTVAYFNQTVGDRVLFAVDESTLSEAARSTVLSQANWLLENTEFTAIIEGHADEQGTREYNLALGARRASAVQQFLIAQGVTPSRLRTVTYGKERPLEICSEESCYNKNRRAVTVLTAGAGT